jgi:DNA invertase Pin-like site-specific DNA recombinase
MLDIVKRIRAKKATSVLPGIRTINADDPTSELLFNVLAAIAQFERQIMLARQREGIAKAKAEGKYKGRKPKARITRTRSKRSRPKGSAKPRSRGASACTGRAFIAFWRGKVTSPTPAGER